MPRVFPTRSIAVALLAGGVLVAIFAVLLLHFRRDLRDTIHRKIIERDAAVLHPVALQQIREEEARSGPFGSGSNSDMVFTVLQTAQVSGMLAITVFDADGGPLRSVPSTLLFADLSAEDYLELTQLRPISRYHPEFPPELLLAGIRAPQQTAPVLEILLPMHTPGSHGLVGIAQYFVDARPLAIELAAIDRQITAQTNATLGIGAALIGLVVALATAGLTRVQRIIAERNERLVRANFELTLAAKASALGQITSHLLHGLQGPVAGLRAVMAGTHDATSSEDWQTAADYTDRLQKMIQETVSLLGERHAETAYELSGHDLLAALRERHQKQPASPHVTLALKGGFNEPVDSTRGNVLCLIAGNLLDNAIQASAPGATVTLSLTLEAGDGVRLAVTDCGEGIPEAVRNRLFQPGRSGRVGGTGLGLAISHLLARQIDADLALVSTGPTGTTFALTLVRVSAR